MQPAWDSPAPAIRLADVAAHPHKVVCVAGKVIDASNPSLVKIQNLTGTVVTVKRDSSSPTIVENSMHIMVRGVVNLDRSIGESPDFPTTDLGEKFDLKLYEESVAVMSQSGISHIFSA
jgi:hypothetical protein